jgi:diguanylate cyclase (GGDEF)-like protein
MLDVDNFKQFNDNYGHAAGDAILYQLGCLFIKHFREEDIVCRYGGDEFVIILPDMNRNNTIERAKHLCEIVKQNPFQYNGMSLESISLSLGVAIFPDNGADFKTILKVVDDTLFCAKHDGRGIVAIADEPVHFS